MSTSWPYKPTLSMPLFQPPASGMTPSDYYSTVLGDTNIQVEALDAVGLRVSISNHNRSEIFSVVFGFVRFIPPGMPLHPSTFEISPGGGSISLQPWIPDLIELHDVLLPCMLTIDRIFYLNVIEESLRIALEQVVALQPEVILETIYWDLPSSPGSRADLEARCIERIMQGEKEIFINSGVLLGKAALADPGNPGSDAEFIFRFMDTDGVNHIPAAYLTNVANEDPQMWAGHPLIEAFTSVKVSQPSKCALTLEKYIEIVMLAELSPSLMNNARNMLSLLRKIYYGSEEWSRTTVDEWDDVIQCGIDFDHPSTIIGSEIWEELKNSQITDCVDLGHVFTGLEAMLCVTPNVVLHLGDDLIPFFGGFPYTVDMPNVEFATWGGDLGSTVAEKVFDELESGAVSDWSEYFLKGRSALEDLLGDIDAYGIRARLSGSCAPPVELSDSSLLFPFSQVLRDYYMGPSSSDALTAANRFTCFVESIGGNISGGGITNKATLLVEISHRVHSWAIMGITKIGVVKTLDILISMPPGNPVTDSAVTDAVDAIIPGSRANVLAQHYALEVVELFLDWLENQME